MEDCSTVAKNLGLLIVLAVATAACGGSSSSLSPDVPTAPVSAQGGATIHPVTGSRSYAVVLVQWEGVTPAIDATNLRNWDMGNVVGFYHDKSDGQLTLIPHMYGPVVMPQPATCDWALIRNTVTAHLAAAGTPIAAEPGTTALNTQYVIENLSVCAQGGWTTTGSPVSYVTAGGWGVMIHELGHSLGWNHAHGEDRDTMSSTYEYGPYDVMGNGPGSNAAHRERLGWLSSSQVQRITASGSYHLTALDSTGSPRALRIVSPIVLSTFGPQTHVYYVEFRAETGVLVWRGVSFPDAPPGEVTCLDNNLAAGQTDYVLNVGQSLRPLTVKSQPEDLTITTVAVDANGATVAITLPGQSRAASGAALSWTPQ
jgi:hypothetical protein